MNGGGVRRQQLGSGRRNLRRINALKPGFLTRLKWTVLAESTGLVLGCVALSAELGPPPKIQPAGGVFAKPAPVTLSTSLPEASLRYTLDGTEPGGDALEYEAEHLQLAADARLRVRAFRDGEPITGVAKADFRIASRNALTSPAPGTIRLRGRLGARHAANTTYLLYLHDAVLDWIRLPDADGGEKGPGVPLAKPGRDFMLDPFRNRETPDAQGWEGEYAGKWLDAAAAMVANRDPNDEATATLAAKVADFARELRKLQEADGYAGIEPPDRRGGSWDVWNQWYFLHANLTQFEQQHEPAALYAAARAGDYLWRNYQPVGTRSLLGGAWDGATTDVLGQLIRLYRHTGNSRYLDIGAFISANFARAAKMRTSGKLHLDASHAYVVCAYLNGLAAYYQATANRRELAWVESVWQDIVAHHLFPEYGLGQAEVFADPGEYRDDSGRETCATMEWLDLTNQLYEATGEVRYAHQLELTVYNALLSAQSSDGLRWCYYTPSRRADGKEWHHPPFFHGSVNCCFFSGPRAVARLPFYPCRLDREGIRIDFYEPLSATGLQLAGGAVGFTLDTAYPADGRVFITIAPERPQAFKLKLRLPPWATGITLAVNGQEAGVPLKAGEYAVLDRTWQNGDEVELHLGLAVRLRRNPAMTGIVGAAIQRGPEVLALDSRDNADLDLAAVTWPARPQLEPLLPTAEGRSRYRLQALVNKAPRAVVLTPLADAGNDGASYRTICPVAVDRKRLARNTMSRIRHAAARRRASE